ncbi:MAG: hypothetical protein C0505_06625 [Leptothrix sp. (in: Bacteria)]|nr:hypothetical protein [Leptothrix sp. (in: b-proteobacteria)]
MDLLRTAVVDITTLLATSHALRSSRGADELAMHRKQRIRLRREIKGGTLAYIDVLARSRRGTVDEALLVECRLAAELQMPQALEHQERLRHLLDHQAGSLDGLAAARQDLWRLAHIIGHLRMGMEALQEALTLFDTRSADALSSRLRRRLRKALTAYARGALRTKALKGRLIVMARAAALAEIGPRGAAEAERLADIEAGADAARRVIARGVTKPLLGLALDWQRNGSGPG